MLNGDRFHMDMTPLVDVAFLLLTFFMFATTMSEPRIMEVAVPPDIAEIPVRSSDLVTLAVRHDGRVFVAEGTAPADYAALGLGELFDFAVQRNTSRANSLITVLKVDPDARYDAVVAVLDQLNLAEGRIADELAKRGLARERRFSIMPIEPEMAKVIDRITN